MAAFEVEGYRELSRVIRKATDRDLPKRIGQAHKHMGGWVIARLEPSPDPQAVGKGAGAKVRPSATKREVLLRAGGKHRAHSDDNVMRLRPWGKRPVKPFQNAPRRPHIIGTARKHEDEFDAELLRSVRDAIAPAFAGFDL